MAVTKVLNIGDCGTGYHGKHLKAAIDYIKASEKTDNGRLVGGINCQPDFAYDRMKSTKVKFGKTDKRQAYHFIISFEEGEVDDDTAFEITQRFAKEYIGNEYEVVFSVHNNTDHKHGHIIFNSVNMVNGKKYRYEKGDWAKYIQPLTNRLCEEYGLSTIDISADGKGINERYKDWNPYRDGKFIWKDMVMRDVDSCIVQASTYDSFLELMEEKGYTIKQGKHMAVMMPGMKRYMRIDTWGSEYTKERITERIREESIADYKPQKERSQPKIVYCKFTRYKRAKLTGLQKKYFAKLYRTGKLKKRSYSQAWKYRDDIKKMHKLHAQYTFLSKYGIKDIEELNDRWQVLDDKRKSINREISRVRRGEKASEKLFKALEKIDELRESENCYIRGDDFFKEEHEQYVLLSDEIKNQGYTVDEIRSLKEHYKNKYAELRSMLKDVKKQLKIADEIIREENEKSERSIEEVREEKQIKERDKQPQK